MGQLSQFVVLFLCVAVTLSAAVSDFDLVLQQVELIKLQIIGLQSGKLARMTCNCCLSAMDPPVLAQWARHKQETSGQSNLT